MTSLLLQEDENKSRSFLTAFLSPTALPGQICLLAPTVSVAAVTTKKGWGERHSLANQEIPCYGFLNNLYMVSSAETTL